MNIVEDIILGVMFIAFLVFVYKIVTKGRKD